MIITREARIKEAQRTYMRAERRIRDLRLEEQAALARGDFLAATLAAQLRQMYQESYDLALGVVLRGGR